MERVFIAHYGEIALKGRNRPAFERRLVENTQRILGGDFRVVKEESRIIITPLGEYAVDDVLNRLKHVLGISVFGYAIRCEPIPETIVETVLETLREAPKPETFAVEAKRSYKQHPFTSLDIRRWVAEAVKNNYGWKLDYSNPSLTIFVEVGRRSAYVYLRRAKGYGGLPVGVSGRVLALLSGGTDSAVASWMMMRRGCRVDFLHLHAYRNSSEVMETKIPALVEALTRYGIRCRLIVASFLPFYQMITQAPPRLELVLFRRYMLHVADRLAALKGYPALATGDSLGQVASQTLPNLVAAQAGVSRPVLRPLIGMDKLAIQQIAEEIGVLEIAQREYKDCCSIVSRHPATSVKPETLIRVWNELGLGRAVEETVEQAEYYVAEIGSGLRRAEAQLQ